MVSQDAAGNNYRVFVACRRSMVNREPQEATLVAIEEKQRRRLRFTPKGVEFRKGPPSGEALIPHYPQPLPAGNSDFGKW